jgi:hypothetical protein
MTLLHLKCWCSGGETTVQHLIEHGADLHVSTHGLHKQLIKWYISCLIVHMYVNSYHRRDSSYTKSLCSVHDTLPPFAHN